MYTEIDLTQKPAQPKIYVCKPDRMIIGQLNEAFNIRQSLKLGSINVLSFSVPLHIDIHHKLSPNPNIEKIKEHYLIKFVRDSFVEWYIINEIAASSDGFGDTKTIYAYSLPYELSYKTIRGYKAADYNATQVLTDALRETLYQIDYIDVDFDTVYRSFEVSSKSVLDFVSEIALAFNALIIWDTENRKISLYNPENFGINRGLSFTYGKLINSIEEVSSADEQCTRLIPYGKDGISISSQNPTGASYLEDFSYFANTDYMSQDLIDAIDNYNQLIQSKRAEFTSYAEEKNSLDSLLLTKKEELQDLLAELNEILDRIDVLLANGQDPAPVLTEKTAKEAEITLKKQEIAQVENNITSVNNAINAIQQSLAVETHFTPEQIKERNYFIIEKVITNENYSKAKDLYDFAQKEFTKIRTPQLSVSIDIVNLLDVMEEQRNWSKLQLGDICTIYYPKLKINIKAKIIEAGFYYENGTVNLTIANVEKILTDKERFLKEHIQNISTSTQVQMDKFKWDGVENNTSEIDRIINQLQGNIASEINLAVNENVSISRRGIIIKDINDPLSYLVATNGVLAITNNDGNSWDNAITKNGIVADRLYGKIIAGVNLSIDASDQQGNKFFTVDSTGVKINGLSLIIDGGLSPSQLDSSFVDSLVNLETPYNGVVLDSANGLVTVRSDNKVRTILNATDGIKIQRNISGAWVNQFSVDSNGALVAEDLIANKLIIKNGGQTLIDANTRTIDFSGFQEISGVLRSSNIPYISADKIQGGTISGVMVNALNTLYVAANQAEGGIFSSGIQLGRSDLVVDPAYIKYFQDQSIALSHLEIWSHGSVNINGYGGVSIGDLSVQGNEVYLGEYTSLNTNRVKGFSNWDQIYIGSGSCRIDVSSNYFRVQANTTNYFRIDPNGSFDFVANGSPVASISSTGNYSGTASNASYAENAGYASTAGSSSSASSLIGTYPSIGSTGCYCDQSGGLWRLKTANGAYFVISDTTVGFYDRYGNFHPIVS